ASQQQGNQHDEMHELCGSGVLQRPESRSKDRTTMIQAMIGNNSPLDRLRQRQRLSLRAQPGSRRAGLTPEEEGLLRQVLAEPMDYIDSDEFYKADAETRIYDKAPSIQRPDVSWYRPLMDDLTP